MSLHRNVTINVDGEAQNVSGFFSTVGGALEAADIELGDHDVVTPSTDSAVSNGSVIDVQYARPLEVVVDGKATTYWTTATTLEDAFTQLGLDVDADARLSEATSRSLGREGLSVDVTTPKKVTLTVGGKKKTVTTTAQTVEDLLTEQKLKVGEDDRLSPKASTAITEGLKVKLDRVEIKKATTTETINYSTTKKNDSSMYVGQSKTVTKGVNGSKEVTTEKTIVNGKVESTKVLKETVTKKATNAVVKVGTKKAATSSSSSSASSSGSGINLANAAMWDRIAQCESGGNWSINTGNGYYGGLQFNYQTWLSAGGGDFASRADLATRAEQITVANRLYAQRGTSPWSCA